MNKTEILDRLIGRLDRKLSEARRDNPCESTLVGAFTYGKSIVRYVFKEQGCELEIWNPQLDYFLDNVAMYCEKRVVKWDMCEVNTTDEWDEHGFRDEQDYINFKYR